MGRTEKEQSANDNPMKEFSSRYFRCFDVSIFNVVLRTSTEYTNMSIGTPLIEITFR